MGAKKKTGFKKKISVTFLLVELHFLVSEEKKVFEVITNNLIHAM